MSLFTYIITYCIIVVITIVNTKKGTTFCVIFTGGLGKKLTERKKLKFYEIWTEKVFLYGCETVSYTHLDVYKRQV